MPLPRRLFESLSFLSPSIPTAVQYCLVRSHVVSLQCRVEGSNCRTQQREQQWGSELAFTLLYLGWPPSLQNTWSPLTTVTQQEVRGEEGRSCLTERVREVTQYILMR